MKISKKISLAAILSALSVVILLLGSVLETVTLSAAAIASLCIAVAVIELGKSYAFITYACTATLAFLLLPNKDPMLYFSCFFGYYPIIKKLTEYLNKPLGYLLKGLTFTAAYAFVAFIGIKFIAPQALELLKYIFIVYPVVLLVFYAFDYALTKLLRYYEINLRKRLGIDKFLK